MIDYSTVAFEFLANDYRWRNESGETFVPNAKDIEIVVGKMRTVLANSDEDDNQISVGRLIMQKIEGHYDLYVYAGSLDAED